MLHGSQTDARACSRASQPHTELLYDVEWGGRRWKLRSVRCACESSFCRDLPVTKGERKPPALLQGNTVCLDSPARESNMQLGNGVRQLRLLPITPSFGREGESPE